MGSKERPTPHNRDNRENWLNRAKAILSLKPSQPRQLAGAGGVNIPTDFNIGVGDKRETEGRAGGAVANPAQKPLTIPQETPEEVAERLLREEAERKKAEERARRQPSPPLTERQKRLRRLALRVGLPAVLGLGAVGGVVTYELNQNPSPTISNEQAPSTFDNSLDRGIIGTNNLAYLSQSEIDQQVPSAFEKINDGKNTLQLEYPFDLSESSDPNTQLTFTKSFSGSSFAEREHYKNTGIYDTFEFKNVPGGTTIRSPVDGYLVISTEENNPPDLTWGNAMGALIDFEAPNGNQYRLFISGATTKDLQNGRFGNTQTGYIFKSLINAPTFKVENNHQVRGSYGIAVKKGELILQVMQPPNNDTIGSVGFIIGVAREGEIGKPIDMSKPSIPTDFELLVTPDGKLISPQ